MQAFALINCQKRVTLHSTLPTAAGTLTSLLGSGSVNSLTEVSLDVLDVLNANRDANQIRLDTSRFLDMV